MSTDREEALLPCPFCGGRCDPEGWYGNEGRGPECEKCGATAPTVSDWQTRQSAPQQDLPPLPKPDHSITDGVATTDYWRVESMASYARLARQSAPQQELRAQFEAELEEVVRYERAKSDTEMHELRAKLEAIRKETASGAYVVDRMARIRELVLDAAPPATPDAEAWREKLVESLAEQMRLKLALEAAAAQPDVVVGGLLSEAKIEAMWAESCRQTTHKAYKYFAHLVQSDVAASNVVRDALLGALADAAQSLEAIARLAGIDKYMREVDEIRAYATNRAAVAFAAMHQSAQEGN